MYFRSLEELQGAQGELQAHVDLVESLFGVTLPPGPMIGEGPSKDELDKPDPYIERMMGEALKQVSNPDDKIVGQHIRQLSVELMKGQLALAQYCRASVQLLAKSAAQKDAPRVP